MYVHGVPKGQDKWNVEESDRNYIESFYGIRKPSVSTLMYVEVKKSGQITYCYYTYFHDKVRDCNGRPGGYIALTLRINHYYTDVQNIYNLLDAAYNKFIVGRIVRTDNEVIRFCVSDFSQEKAMLLDLEKELYKYLMQFSSDSDFVPLDGFVINGQNQSVDINILECNVQEVARYMKSNGSVSVSSLFPSKKEQQIRQRMKEDYDANCVRLQKQAEEAHANAQREINVIKDAHNNEILSLHDSLDKAQQECACLKKHVAELKQERQIAESLRRDLDKAEQECARQKKDMASLKQELQYIKSCRYDDVKSALDNKNDILKKIQDLLKKPSGLGKNKEHSGIDNYNNNGDSQKPDTGGDSDPTFRERLSKQGKLFTGILGLSRKLLIPIAFVVLFVVLAVEFVMFSNVKEELLKNSNDLLEMVADKVSASLPTVPNSTPMHNNADKDDEISKEQINAMKSKARIDIAELTPETQHMELSKTYTVSLKNIDEQLSDKIKWVSEDFTVKEGYKIKPKKKGNCVIHCLLTATGDTIKSRTINVK